MRHAIVLAVAVIIAVTLAPRGAGAEEIQRTLSLTGTGEVSAPPDIATIDLGVVSEAATARAALDANTGAMNRVMAVIGEHGIAASDVQTSGFSVQPRYVHDPENRVPPRVVGYQVNNTVHVTVRELDRLGRVLDAVVTGGSNTIQRLAFSFSDPASLLDEAHRKAGADARHRAELLAEGLGVRLGRIVQISEAGGRPPQPYLIRAEAMMSADVPIAAGEQAVSAGVSVTWEIE